METRNIASTVLPNTALGWIERSSAIMRNGPVWQLVMGVISKIVRFGFGWGNLTQERIENERKIDGPTTIG